MKRNFKTNILLTVFLLAGYTVCSQTIPPGAAADQNYVATFTPRVSNITTNAALNTNVADKKKVGTTIQYFDGLGRPLQTVQRQASPLGYDIVEPFAYDAYGREATKYLPYTEQTGTAGSYKTDALTPGAGQAKFYATTPGGGIPVTPNPYALTVFESSPLNRTLEQGAPGTDWQPVANSTAGHTQKIDYTTNNTSGITDTANTMLAMLYTVTINANQSRTLSQNGSYGAGQLYVTVSKDENWKGGRGGTTEEYKDKEGHVVLKRTFNYAGTTLQILSTYYVYDDLGNLAFVLPPGTNPDALGVPPFAGSLGYSYRYDERNRMTQKKIPGKGWEFTVYNKLDQPVLSQDSLQRQSNQWVVTKYDALGRVIVTGLWNAGAVIPLATLQNSVYAGAQWDKRDSTNTLANYPTGYILSSYPTISKTLTINYYDDYTFPANPFTATVPGTLSTPKGLLTASKTAVLNTIGNASPDMMWTVHYYDGHGRNVQSFHRHYLGGSLNAGNYDVITNTYNFNDQVTQTVRQHWTAASTANPQLTITNQYSYDHMGRKLTTREQIRNGTQAADVNPILSKIDYNEVGQVWKKNLHSTDSTTFKQTVTYGYNERGWLKNSSAPLFAETLNYNDAVNTSKQYNGNIANQYWGTAGNQGNHSTYYYDQLNRLTAGWATTGNNERGITYDPMGNITALTRDANNGPIDQLSYTYPQGTNKLQSVNDAIAGTVGQKGGVTNYTYDGNGNLLSDDSKGITAISYNLLNLPQIIAGKGTTYTYDATGQKLSRLIGTAKTDYIDGIQYDGSTTASTISFIQTEEGRALPNGATAYNYEYTLTDHLGNSRVNFDTGTGVARQVQADDYYPFGMDVIVGNRPNVKNNYLYNKKELQDNLGLYDYGARFYDPVIARFTTIDRFAEKYAHMSTYQYAALNPIKNIDIHGDSVNFVLLQRYDTNNRTNVTGNIVNDLSPETGLNLSVGNNGQLEYAKDPHTGQPIVNYEDDGQGGLREVGSSTARDAMVNAIDNPTTAYVKAGTRSSSIVGGTLINIDPTQISKFISGSNNLDSRTLGFGMTFLHEMIHSGLGGGLTDPPVSAGFGPTGATVDKMNIIRSELNHQGLNFGQRTSYQGIMLSPGGPAYLPFSQSSLNSLQGGIVPVNTDNFIKYIP